MVITMVDIIRGSLTGFSLVLGVTGQFEEEEKPFRGQLIGSLNSYHHQVGHTAPPHHQDTRPGKLLTFHL